MRQLIGQRQGEVTPSSRPKSFIDNSQTPVRGMSIGDSSQSEFHRTMGTLVSEADKGLAQVISNQDVLHTSLERLTSAFQEVILPFILHKTFQIDRIIEIWGTGKD